jgi:hypothetical protein
MAPSSVATTFRCALTPAEPVGGAVCPLLWQHGEPAEVLREELRQMHSVGIRQCILESRPHPDYLGKGWWESLDAILDEAGRLGMKVWFFDDCTYPSGFAGGRVRDRHPHLLKVYLAERTIDARGPLRGASFRIQPWLQPDASIVGAVAGQDRLSPRFDYNGQLGDELVAVVAARRPDGDGDALDGSTLLDPPAR